MAGAQASVNTDSPSSDSRGEIQFNTSLSLTIAELFYRSFKRLFEGEAFVDDVDNDLKKANISTPVEIYISAALGYGTIIGAFIGLLTSLGAWLVFSTQVGGAFLEPSMFPFSESLITNTVVAVLNLVQYPLLSILLGISGAILGFFMALTFATYYPKHLKRSRRREINLVLSDAIAFMYSLSVGGTNQLQVMKAVANAEDTYGEVSVEFTRIVYDMEYFNTDYQTAVANISERTPSKELSAFLSDMLSVIDSGGNMTTFLQTQQEMMREKGRKKQEEMLDTLEFFGEMYMSLSILPMGLLIVLVIVSMMGDPQILALYATVYAILPGINVMFAILVSTVKKDEVGDGRLDTEGNIAASGEDETRLTEVGVIEHYMSGPNNWFFKPIRAHEIRYRVQQVLKSPWEFFRIRPSYVLMITIPVTILVMVLLVATGLAAPSRQEMVLNPYIQTVMWMYVPLFLNLVPLAVFYEWNRRTRGRITDTLTQDIRKLANANETGQPILEAMQVSSDGRESLMGKEFNRMYKKAKFGTSLSAALVEFNNRYRIPRLARIVKLIQKAQEASSNITEVLNTAAVTSRYQDEIEQERLQRTRMQVAVIAITYIVFLGVITMLDVYFLGEMLSGVELESDNPIGSGFADIDITLISMLFFHAVTIQALCAGAVSGYIQTGRISSSYKYIVLYMTLAAIAWGAIAV